VAPTVKQRPVPDASFVEQQSQRLQLLLRERAALSEEDLGYLVERVDKMRDERLKSCVAGLIGWGDDERAEIETFVAIALEVMKHTNVSKLREAARLVHLRVLTKELTNAL
jgi:hypothetical protein